MITDCPTVHALPHVTVVKEHHSSLSPSDMRIEHSGLEDNGLISVPRSVHGFNAAEAFIEDNPRVKFSTEYCSIGPNFKQWFIKDRQPDPALESSKLRVFTLKEGLDTATLRRQLSGLSGLNIELLKIYLKMLRQPTGENGDLLTCGSANIFFAFDQTFIPRSVYISYWHGWQIGASRVDQDGLWKVGCRVFVPQWTA